MQELLGHHTPETEEFGIASFVYRQRRPFHAVRLLAVCTEGRLRGILRSKGLFYVAQDVRIALEWHTAGSTMDQRVHGLWGTPAAVTAGTVADGAGTTATEGLDGALQDQRNEMVFIGVGHDEAAIRLALDAALLTDAEMALGPAVWTTWDNPWKHLLAEAQALLKQ